MSLYTPDYKMIEAESSVYFDGSESSSGAATIKEMSGNVNVRVYLERSNDGGESYEEISQFASGDLRGAWHTDNIQPMIEENTRRLRIDNTDNHDGLIEVIGEEL